MRHNALRLALLSAALFLCAGPLASQTHVSVPLDNPVYGIIEQARQRGLCRNLPDAKPYSRAVVRSVLNEILSAGSDGKGALSEKERRIVRGLLDSFRHEPGLDLRRGVFRHQNRAASDSASAPSAQSRGGIPMTLEAGLSWESVFSGSLQEGDGSFGTDNWGELFLRGDMGKAFSWGISAGGGIVRARRERLGTYHPFYEGFDTSGGRDNTPVTVRSQPEAFFPYAFQKNWDFSVFYAENLSSSGFYEWPDGLAFGYNILSEMDLSLLDGNILLRWGRLRREAAGAGNGNSLALNSAARPFLGLEGTFTPFSWLSLYSLTGVLEYYNDSGIAKSAETFQNAFSLSMAQVDFGKYARLALGSSAVWAKRFDMGYLFPLNSNFFYQNNTGDFDNLGMFATLTAFLPGRGKAWLSVFADELDLSSPNFLHQDRNMYALQAGAELSVRIPRMAFGNVSLQYTKIEPYTYTHQRTRTPWYGDSWMETAYENNGVCLGYYLPPNSDELKLRLQAMPSPGSSVHIQYQMIRHGADWGSGAVDGSSLASQLDPDGRNDKAVLWKHFLHDGVYQWQHVVKIGGSYDFSAQGVPLELFGDFGVVAALFTGIDGSPNSGESHPYHRIDTDEYPASVRFVATVGFRLYP